MTSTMMSSCALGDKCLVTLNRLLFYNGGTYCLHVNSAIVIKLSSLPHVLLSLNACSMQIWRGRPGRFGYLVTCGDIT